MLRRPSLIRLLAGLLVPSLLAGVPPVSAGAIRDLGASAGAPDATVFGAHGSLAGSPDHAGKIMATGDLGGGPGGVPDGIPDLVLGADREGGSVAIVFGPILSDVDLLTAVDVVLDQSQGGSLAIGDVNGDGRDDLLAATPNADAPAVLDGSGETILSSRVDAGRVDIYFGPIVPGATPDRVIYGEGHGDSTGESTTNGRGIAVGQLDGIGAVDIAIGLPAADGPEPDNARCAAGAVHLLFSGGVAPPVWHLHQSVTYFGGGVQVGSHVVLHGENPNLFSGCGVCDGPCELTGDLLGSTILADRDLDGDGLDDLVLAVRDAYEPPASQPGKAYVIYGRSPACWFSGDTPRWDLTVRPPDVLFVGRLSEMGFGRGIAAGDLSGDGEPDIAVAGSTSTIVYCGPWDRGSGPCPGPSSEIRLDDTPPSLELATTGQPGTLGHAVAIADLDRDGIDELVVGAHGTPAGWDPLEPLPPGRAYLACGPLPCDGSTIDLEDDPSVLQIWGIDTNGGNAGEDADQLGWDILAADIGPPGGDWELILGAPGADSVGNARTDAGEVYALQSGDCPWCVDELTVDAGPDEVTDCEDDGSGDYVIPLTDATVTGTGLDLSWSISNGEGTCPIFAWVVPDDDLPAAVVIPNLPGDECGASCVVTLTARDCTGTSISDTTRVGIEDDVAPTWTFAPPGGPLECGVDSLPDPSDPAWRPVADDNCGSDVDLVHDDVTDAPTGCVSFGDVHRTWTATDGCGNSVEHVQVFTWDDTEPPAWDAFPADTTAECGSSLDPSLLGMPTASDSCSGAVTPTSADTVVGDAGCVAGGLIARTWTATDDCGNEIARVQTITLVDTTPPELHVPDDRNVSCAEACSDHSPDCDGGWAWAKDDCDADVDVSWSDSTSPGDCPQESVIERTWTATDDCGNETSAVQVLRVIDQAPPTFTSFPPDEVLECGVDELPDPADPAHRPTGEDSCDPDPMITHVGDANGELTGCAGPIEIRRTWRIEDACGNSALRDQSFYYFDTTPPVLDVGSEPLLVDCDEEPPTPLVTDSCDESPSLTMLSEERIDGPCQDTYTLTRTWRAVDACENEATEVQVIEVRDMEPPVITMAPEDLTVECGSVPPADVPPVVDDCDPSPTLEYAQSPPQPGPCTGSYVLRRTWTPRDRCGNTGASVTQEITVMDTLPPVLVGVPADESVDCTVPPASPDVSAWDACLGEVEVSVTDLVEEGCPRTVQRTYSASDGCMNVVEQVQRITVHVDPPEPTFEAELAVATIPVSVPGGPCPAVATFANTTGNDGCGPEEEHWEFGSGADPERWDAPLVGMSPPPVTYDTPGLYFPTLTARTSECEAVGELECGLCVPGCVRWFARRDGGSTPGYVLCGEDSPCEAPDLLVSFVPDELCCPDPGSAGVAPGGTSSLTLSGCGGGPPVVVDADEVVADPVLPGTVTARFDAECVFNALLTLGCSCENLATLVARVEATFALTCGGCTYPPLHADTGDISGAGGPVQCAGDDCLEDALPCPDC